MLLTAALLAGRGEEILMDAVEVWLEVSVSGRSSASSFTLATLIRWRMIGELVDTWPAGADCCLSTSPRPAPPNYHKH